MTFSVSHVRNEFKPILQKLSACLASLNLEYLLSKKKPEKYTKPHFIEKAILLLTQYSDLLNHGKAENKVALAKLLAKCHENFSQELNQATTNSVLLFNENVKDLINALEKELPKDNKLSIEQNLKIRPLIDNLIQNISNFFERRSYNHDLMLEQQALTIAYSIDDLNLEEQKKLGKDLLFVKELWQIHEPINIEQDDAILAFHYAPMKILSNLRLTNAKFAFEKILDLFIHRYKALQYLSNEDLIKLYHKLQNASIDNKVIYDLLLNIHIEAPARYSHNRLSDSEYELLEHFQNYDAITHQIENAEFLIAEFFLLKNMNFIEEILTLISRHLDNIRALEIFQTEAFQIMFEKIEEENNNQKLLDFAKSIKNRLLKKLDKHVNQRYSELNKFTIAELSNKYTRLFEQIINLLDLNQDNHIYLQNSIVKKLSKNYHFTNNFASATHFREIEKDRKKIETMLNEIDFIQIFTPRGQNKISSFNFKKQLARHHFESPEDYIDSIFKILLSSLTSSQIQRLYGSLNSDKLSKIQLKLKRYLLQNIKNRTTISKMLYSFFTGKREEFAQLRDILNSLDDRALNDKMEL